MNRIRLVWSRMWNVLSDFFVSVGLFENLSVAIFVMDSLRQLAMKFLEREELANYNFQNEFLRPFVIIMQKSSCTEIKELIVRCISQMVLSRVGNVKSGWKSVFMVSCKFIYIRKIILGFKSLHRDEIILVGSCIHINLTQQSERSCKSNIFLICSKMKMKYGRQVYNYNLIWMSEDYLQNSVW